MKAKNRRGSADGQSQDVLGPLQDLVRQLRSGVRTKQQLVDFNEGRNPFAKKAEAPKASNWPTWKTLKLGTGLKTADDFRKAIKASGQTIGDWANDILGKSAFTAANQETEVELVKATVKELTGKVQATYQEICQSAEKRGWKKCPNEVGPQLRLQYQDQPYGEWLVIAMEPITGSDGGLELFNVGHGVSGRWLSGSYGSPASAWLGDNEFVFRK